MNHRTFALSHGVKKGFIFFVCLLCFFLLFGVSSSLALPYSINVSGTIDDNPSISNWCRTPTAENMSLSGLDFEGTLSLWDADISGAPYTHFFTCTIKVGGMELAPYNNIFCSVTTNPADRDSGIHVDSQFDDSADIHLLLNYFENGHYTDSLRICEGGQFLINASSFSYSYTAATPVPEPCALLLIGSGLLGLAGFRKKLKS